MLVLGLLNTAATCKYTVRDTEVCTVAGIMAAGMDCGHTRTDETRSMNLDEALTFLEPFEGDKKNPPRAGAMCISADGYTQNKTDIETLCRMLGPKCSYEVKEALAAADKRMTKLQKKSMVQKITIKNKPIAR